MLACNFLVHVSFLCVLASRFVFCCNHRPIIGIVAAETNGTRWEKYGSSYITASYVKFLEAAGSRVVPIKIYETESYYRNLMSKINGILFPGGGDLLQGIGYGRTGRIVYNLAVEFNQKKDYFPLWGTCLGLELLAYLSAGEKLWMTLCDANDVASPLHFLALARESKMLRGVDDSLWRSMAKENVTVNYHHWCLTFQNFTRSGLGNFYRVLSWNEDRKGNMYISSMEGRWYPFYAVSFHPEMPLFEWVNSPSSHNIPHEPNAIRVSQHFANFFISETRKSGHRFASKQEEDEHLIYNYNPLFTGAQNSSSQQKYFF